MKKTVFSIIAGGALFLALFLMTALPHTANRAGFTARAVYAAWCGIIGFLIFNTGKISRYRAVFFIVIAAGFLLAFKTGSVEFPAVKDTPSYTLSPNLPEAPFCHIAMSANMGHTVSNILAALQSSLRYLRGYVFIFLWLGITLLAGQAWCAWVCFYGGIDEAFSCILKKPLIKLTGVSPKIRNFSLGFLFFLLLASFSMAVPVFCKWFCPLKLNTVFLDVFAPVRNVQLISFVSIGIIFLVVGPVLTKKRTFCGIICPFGAWQSVAGQLNPYRVAIDKEKCNMCKKCVRACCNFSLTEGSLRSYEISPACVRCGKCIDVCPQKAIRFTVLGKDISGRYFNLQNILVFSMLLLGGTVSSFFVPAGILQAARVIYGIFQ